MTKEKINGLLADAVGKYGLMIGTKVTKNVVNKLPTTSEIKTFNSKEDDSFLNARNALMECGKVLLEDRENHIIEGIIYAGVANMNPSIAVIYVTKKEIQIATYAKEGLIKQHTAKKAIERFESVL